MDRKIILSLLAVILLVLAVAILMPGGRQADSQPKLPWQIQLDEQGRTQVFGLTLGASTLSDAQQLLQQQAKATLFLSPEGIYSAEAYFQRAALSGLRADFVLTMTLSQEAAARMFDRGLRLSKLGSGVQKVELSQSDLAELGSTPIDHITYIPGTDLEPDLIKRHFGEPTRQISESNGITHWLYPQKGLDIAVNPDGKEVFQYLPPGQFERLLAPLQPDTQH
ncbi:hypothetical protein [Motiliproteus sediminis]|uniref:hypothetical protein n=1 Tax=Motiliproteus sediminis TaxID=1468178 RepID=UPI001AEF44C9|nr:hypothetical protein [Motiliproteus sediminis]